MSATYVRTENTLQSVLDTFEVSKFSRFSKG